MTLTVATDYNNGASYFYAQQAPAERGWGGAARDFDIAALLEAGLRKRLAELESLREGWDGEGAEPISSKTLKNALEVGLLLSSSAVPAPEITPNVGDTLTFEWDSKAGSALLEIGHTTYSFLMTAKSGKRSTDRGPLAQTGNIANLGTLIRSSLY